MKHLANIKYALQSNVKAGSKKKQKKMLKRKKHIMHVIEKKNV